MVLAAITVGLFLSTPSAELTGMLAEKFLSTPSARRATVSVKVKRALHQRFLSTPSARRATKDGIMHTIMSLISIHALREEGDPHHHR